MGENNVFIALGQALVAVFGSFVKWINEEKNEKRGLRTFVSEVVSGAFSGVIVFMIYSWLNLNMYLAFCLAGLLGNLGAKGIDALGKFVVQRSGLVGLDVKCNTGEPKDKDDLQQ